MQLVAQPVGTAATLALERGESIKAVAAMLEDTEATVMRVYAHATPLMQESLMATMDSLLGVSDSRDAQRSVAHQL